MKKSILVVMPVLFFSFLNAQNIGIGTTTPLEKLSVVSVSGYGISHESSSIKLSTYIDGSGAYIGTTTNNPFHLYTNNGAAQFTLLQNGNIGIGNINPQYKLDITGRMRVKTGTVGNAFTSSGIWFEDYRDGTNRIFLGMQDSIRLGIWGEGSPGAGWAFNFNARNGNTGIGVANPTNKLEVAGVITANSFQFTSPKSYYYSIPPSAFVSKRIYIAQGGDFWTEYGSISSSALKYDGYYSKGFVAPVQLPDGATITSISFYLIDNSSTENLTCSLRRRLHQGDIYLNMCSLATASTPGLITLTTNSIGFAVIDNQNYNYTISIDPELTDHWINDDLQIKSVRIAYTLPGF